jgi:hypothetical protein
MKGFIIFTGFLSAAILCSCEGNFQLISTLPVNDTTEFSNFETRYNFEHKLSLRMDSVLNDSRCPAHVDCVWEGNAGVRFLFKVDTVQTPFILNTQGGSQFRSDTTIGDYEITLLDLTPYPEDPGEILQVEYTAKILLRAI